MATRTLDYEVELPRAARGLADEELERYVRVFEDDPGGLERGCRYCALGAMAGVHEGADKVFAYHDMRRKANRNRDVDAPPSPYRVIEDVFEEWDLLSEYAFWDGFPDDARLAIYEACVEELARRASEDVEPIAEPALAAVETEHG